MYVFLFFGERAGEPFRNLEDMDLHACRSVPGDDEAHMLSKHGHDLQATHTASYMYIVSEDHCFRGCSPFVSLCLSLSICEVLLDRQKDPEDQDEDSQERPVQMPLDGLF